MKSSALFLATWKTYLNIFIHLWLYSTHFVNSRNRHLTGYIISTVGDDLKGQLHEFFCFPQAPENNTRDISDFFKNSQRHSQVKLHYRCQRHRQQICHRYQRHRWIILPPVPVVDGRRYQRIVWARITVHSSVHLYVSTYHSSMKLKGEETPNFSKKFLSLFPIYLRTAIYTSSYTAIFHKFFYRFSPFNVGPRFIRPRTYCVELLKTLCGGPAS